MNTLILISLSISEFVDGLGFTVSINDCFILMSIFMLFIFINKNSAINKKNKSEAPIWTH
ncbi:hypothetical protein CXF89_17215 [Pseudoalteromonas sp. MelDa3]|jgi:hypothetical protein|nr:hypothetical protein CXF89_17215 [Pseudoalteromonas sp. MelDa3]